MVALDQPLRNTDRMAGLVFDSTRRPTDTPSGFSREALDQRNWPLAQRLLSRDGATPQRTRTCGLAVSIRSFSLMGVGGGGGGGRWGGGGVGGGVWGGWFGGDNATCGHIEVVEQRPMGSMCNGGRRCTRDPCEDLHALAAYRQRNGPARITSFPSSAGTFAGGGGAGGIAD